MKNIIIAFAIALALSGSAYAEEAMSYGQCRLAITESYYEGNYAKVLSIINKGVSGDQNAYDAVVDEINTPKMNRPHAELGRFLQRNLTTAQNQKKIELMKK